MCDLAFLCFNDEWVKPLLHMTLDLTDPQTSA